ncbi:Nitrilotriacetate monooxygenase component A/pristinamycin IIA synthase subunit A [Bacillus methanolicus PB1]|uniref:Nitrilotriacetate monooxygenase component A/pristinamycin IIA synthase subunit A n=1 Tax=Bacillus methanolicus PB1 TaxID=997296 RepID=I3DVL0_BACMT|nr:LLM class flavin-dependent oxidoreductase [Bacillus methanolicus]EIJ78281.1 Nitrilotriacetate monooxygenase component A/pristinamycin IIA synthase subunit A [Bacillus methanolicus PB1]
MGKQIILNAFEMTSAMHNSHGLWKHPESKRQRRYKELDYWIEMAKLLERGKFDAVFFADVLGVYDTYKQSKEPSIRDGMQIPLIDAALVIPVMASVTKHLSFAFTVSTTYEPPFAHARRFSTLDHLTQGRIAWNVVTSYLPNAARNFGLQEMIRHDRRYDIADEYLEVCYKLWESSWEDGAVIEDVKKGVLIDPSKVHEINHSGEFFHVEGPHLSEPSLQRTPVLYQAGVSERGRECAAKHAECVFVGGPTPERIRFYTEDIKKRAEKYGRNPDNIKVFSFLTVIVGETTEEAERKYQELNRLWSPDAAKAQFGGASGYDLSRYEKSDLDQPFEFKPTEHGHYKAASLTKDASKKLKVGEALSRLENIDREQVIVGNPTEVADAIQYQFEASGVDGFNLNHLVTPGSLEDFIGLVVPILQKRGLYKTEYKHGTLREKLFDHGSSLLPEDHPGSQYRGTYSTVKN